MVSWERVMAIKSKNWNVDGDIINRPAKSSPHKSRAENFADQISTGGESLFDKHFLFSRSACARFCFTRFCASAAMNNERCLSLISPFSGRSIIIHSKKNDRPINWLCNKIKTTFTLLKESGIWFASAGFFTRMYFSVYRLGRYDNETYVRAPRSY